MPYTYTLRSVIPATPEQIYAAWLDSLAHTDMTGGEASMSDEVGALVSAWDGYITGRNIELVPGRRIVQSWRTSRFTDAHADSIITVTLRSGTGGTVLTLEHSNVPDDQRNYEDGGWEENYFQPMKDYFAALAQEIGDEQPLPAAPKAKPRPKPVRAAKPKRARKAAPRKQPQRVKANRAAAPKAKRKGAASRPKKRKSARKPAKSPPTRATRKPARRQRTRR